MTTQEIVAKLWNLCNVLRDDGITYQDYVTELTYILFLKMMNETGREEQLPQGYRWDDLTSKSDLAFDALKSLLSEQASGTTVKGVKLNAVQTLSIPLPPEAEQFRIIDITQRLFSKLDDAEATMREVIDGSKRRQAAVLHKAFSGDLTAQWRRKHKGRGMSSIADIAEYATAWKAKDQRLLAEQQATCINQHLDGRIWTKCTVGAIGRVTNGSTPSRKVPAYWGGDIPWVSSGEVRNNVISETNECITNAGYEGSSVNLLPAGTVLIAMIGEGKTRGQSAILDIPATINQNVAAVIIDHGFVDPRFLWYWFKYSYKRNREVGSGTGPQALNCQRVRELPFILPELDEQKEIIKRLDDLIDNEQQMQTLALDALAAIGTLRETILSRALRGELGTNDPDEPSSKELLASIINSNAGRR